MKQQAVTVTGASGFVGSHIVETFVKKGYFVQALYRREKPPPHLAVLAGNSCKLIRIDLDGQEAQEKMTPILRSTPLVIHAAARTGDWGSLRLFMQSNYQPTVMMLNAAAAAECRKFVYVGTIAVHGFGNHTDTGEDGPYYPVRNPYQISKLKAEQEVIEANGKDLNTTVIRPGNVYGPRDTTTSFPIFDALQRGLMGYLGSGNTLTCPVYIDDLVEAITKAADSEISSGEIFNIVGPDRVTWHEYFEETAALLKCKAPTIHLSPFIAKTAAAVLQGVYSLFRIKSSPPITFYRVFQLINNYHFSYQKAKKILGYEPRTDYKTGLANTVEDYLQNQKVS